MVIFPTSLFYDAFTWCSAHAAGALTFVMRDKSKQKHARGVELAVGKNYRRSLFISFTRYSFLLTVDEETRGYFTIIFALLQIFP